MSGGQVVRGLWWQVDILSESYNMLKMDSAEGIKNNNEPKLTIAARFYMFVAGERRECHCKLSGG